MNSTSFDVWLVSLKEDASRRGETFAKGISNMPKLTLQLFFNDGVEGSIAGILEGKKPGDNGYFEERRFGERRKFARAA